MFLRSERLFLRPGWAEDRDDLLAGIADHAVVRNLASVPWPYGEADAEAFLALPAAHRLPRFLVTVPGPAGARVAGAIGLHEGPDDAAELGYWIARDDWGKGYASEAVGAVLGLARTLGHRRIVASHYIDNPASGRVLAKAGFRRTGRVVERFSQGRGLACPAREYELVFAAPGDFDRDGDGSDGHRGEHAMMRRRAA